MKFLLAKALIAMLITIASALSVSASVYAANEYGPGIHADETGRPYIYPDPYTGEPLITPVEPDVYGPGIGQDIYGRPVYPEGFDDFGLPDDF